MAAVIPFLRHLLVSQYNQEISEILTMPDVREKLLANGIEPVGKSVKDFEQMLKADLSRATNLARSANIKAE